MMRSKLIGHRGMGTTKCSPTYAENSIESLVKALSMGADGVEFDVHLSRDGVPVLYHDAELGDAAALDGPWAQYKGRPIAELDAELLTQIPLRKGDKQTIPTLESALDAIAPLSQGKEVWIELKTPHHNDEDNQQRLAQQVKQVLDGHPIEEAAQVWFLSFNRPLLHCIQDAYEATPIKTIYILGLDDVLKAKQHIGLAVASGFSGVGLHPLLAPLFKVARESGLRAVSGGLGVDIDAFTKALLRNPARVAFTTDELSAALLFRDHIQGSRNKSAGRNKSLNEPGFPIRGYVTHEILDLFEVDQSSLDIQLSFEAGTAAQVLQALEAALADHATVTVYEQMDTALQLNLKTTTQPRAWCWQRIHDLHLNGLVEQAVPLIRRREHWFVPQLRRFAVDPDARYLWALEQVRAKDAWDRFWAKWPGKNLAEDIVVGHIDSGFTKHPCFDGDGTQRIDVDKGRDYLKHISGAPIESDPESTHGLRTGSVIAGNQASGLGVAPTSTLLPCRVVKKSFIHEAILWGKYFGGKEMERLARALEHCIEQGVDVISISLGGAEVHDGVKAALKKAYESNIIVIVAAGNFVPGIMFPANSEYTICCGATGPDETPWIGSGRGPWIDVCAPGDEVTVATINDVHNHTTSFGTSYSTAFTAGACALWLSYWGDALDIYDGEVPLTEVFRYVVQITSRDIKHAWLLVDDVGLLDINALLAYGLPSVDAVRDWTRDAGTQVPSSDVPVSMGIEAYLNMLLEAHGSSYALDHGHAWPLCEAFLGEQVYDGYYYELLDAIVSSDIMRPTYVNLYGHQHLELSTLKWLVYGEARDDLSNALQNQLVQ